MGAESFSNPGHQLILPHLLPFLTMIILLEGLTYMNCPSIPIARKS